MKSAKSNGKITDRQKKSGRVIWAVDTTQSPSHTKEILALLKIWAKQVGCTVLPVSVFSQEEFMATQRNNTHETLKSYLARVGLKTSENPRVLMAESDSARGYAYEVAKFAKDVGAEMIFAQTRARRTWNPFRLGGFAETLIAVSPVPIMLLNPSAKAPKKIKNILFPTDFGTSSKRALLRLTPWVKSLGAKVLLFHRVQYPNLVSMGVGGETAITPYNLEEFVTDEQSRKMRRANAWREHLRLVQVKSAAAIETEQRSLGEDVLANARKNKTDLIALANNTGPFAQTIMGSLARDLLLQAKCPVLVFFKPQSVRDSKLKRAGRTLRLSVPKPHKSSKLKSINLQLKDQH